MNRTRSWAVPLLPLVLLAQTVGGAAALEFLPHEHLPWGPGQPPGDGHGHRFSGHGAPDCLSEDGGLLSLLSHPALGSSSPALVPAEAAPLAADRPNVGPVLPLETKLVRQHELRPPIPPPRSA